jgi:hypothetical protein
MTNEPQQGASELTREEIDELVKFVEKACSHKAFNHDDGEPLLWPQRVLRGLIASTTAVAPAVAEPVAMCNFGCRVLWTNIFGNTFTGTIHSVQHHEAWERPQYGIRFDDGSYCEASEKEFVYLDTHPPAPPERTAQPTGASEPVAWQYKSKFNGWMTCSDAERAFFQKAGLEIRPLYTAQPNWREPLEALENKMNLAAHSAEFYGNGDVAASFVAQWAAELRAVIDKLGAQRGEG